jgi:MFS transporter, DHA1 family, multidrug resistance protein
MRKTVIPPEEPPEGDDRIPGVAGGGDDPGVPGGAFAHAPVLIACVLTFSHYLGTYMRLPLVPIFARDLGASTVQVGMINAGFMLSATLLSLPLGLVSDRLGRRRLVLAGMAVSGLTALLLLLVRTPAQVGAVYLFSGIGLACFSPAMMSYVGDVSPAPFLGRAYGWLTSALYLGMAAGPGLGGAVAAYGFEAAFILSALVAAAAIAGLAPRMPAPPPAATPASPDFLRDVREIGGNRAVLACWTVTFFVTYAWGALFAFFPLHAGDSGISIMHTGLIFTTQAAANALFRIPIGHLSDRTGRRDLYIVAGSLLFAVFVMLVGRFERPLPLYLLFAAVGAATAATFTAVGAVISEAVPTRIRGLAMGGYNTCIYGGFAASAATLGTVIERYGFPAGFAAAGAVCAAAALLFGPFISPRRRKTRTFPEAG